MRAVLYREFGPPSVLEIEERHEVVVRTRLPRRLAVGDQLIRSHRTLSTSPATEGAPTPNLPADCLQKPSRKKGELLVQVYATSVNPIDCKTRRGDIPRFMACRPKVLCAKCQSFVSLMRRRRTRSCMQVSAALPCKHNMRVSLFSCLLLSMLGFD